MKTMISLGDMMLVLLTIAGVAALIFVAIAMVKVSALASRAKQVLDKTRLAVRDTLKGMPALVQDAGKSVADAKKTLDTVLPQLKTITGNMEVITTDGRETLGTVKQVKIGRAHV